MGLGQADVTSKCHHMTHGNDLPDMGKVEISRYIRTKQDQYLHR